MGKPGVISSKPAKETVGQSLGGRHESCLPLLPGSRGSNPDTIVLRGTHSAVQLITGRMPGATGYPKALGVFLQASAPSVPGDQAPSTPECFGPRATRSAGGEPILGNSMAQQGLSAGPNFKTPSARHSPATLQCTGRDLHTRFELCRPPARRAKT